MRTRWGSYTIPRSRLSLLLDHLMVLMDAYPQGIFTRLEFVQALNLSKSSGGPDHKLSSLQQYGLILRKSADHYALTIDASTLLPFTHPISIEKIVRHIRLWDKLLDSIGTEFDDAKFVSAINTITGVPDNEITSELSSLKYAYTDDIACINKTPPFSAWSLSRQKNKQKVAPQQYSSQDTTKSPIKQTRTKTPYNANKRKSTKYKLTFQYGGTPIEVKDASSIALARILLNEIEKEIIAKGGSKMET